MTFREILSSREGGNPSLIRHAHTLACTYLRLKRRNRAPHLHDAVASISDLAWDCIGPLFECDDQGRFVRIAAWMDRVDAANLSDTDLDIRFRQFLFQSVNDELFAHYRESDPGLSKIIRNLKLAIGMNADTTLWHSPHGIWVRFGQEESTDQPVMAPEFLLARLSARCSGKGDLRIPDMLSITGDILLSQPAYAPELRLMDLAMAIRDVSALMRVESEQPDTEPVLTESEWVGYIQKSLHKLDASHGRAYIRRGTITEDMWVHYRSLIGRVLGDLFTETEPRSYYQLLSELVPGLVESDYRRDHRPQVEYLVRLAKGTLRDELKKEFG